VISKTHKSNIGRVLDLGTEIIIGLPSSLLQSNGTFPIYETAEKKKLPSFHFTDANIDKFTILAWLGNYVQSWKWMPQQSGGLFDWINICSLGWRLTNKEKELNV
jgi:hypothetical protein